MIDYLLKSSICLGCFYLVYHLLLRNNKFFNWQRVYLLTVLLLSFLIPLLQFESQREIIDPLPVMTEALTYLKIPQSAAPVDNSFDWTDLFYVLYFIGVLAFLTRLIVIAVRLRGLIRQSSYEQHGRYTLLYTDKPVFAASFYRYIFIEKTVRITEETLNYLLIHEKKHIRDYHFIDITLIHLIQVVCWFNPFVYLTGYSLRTVHEYICDAEVVRHTNAKKYEKLLIRSFFTQVGVPLLSQFSETSIKNRLIMMNKQNSIWQKKLKFLAIIPFTLMLVYACNNEQLATEESLSSEFSGVIKNENGETLPGINIVLEGGEVGAVSDIDGNYKLDNRVAKAKTVTFSFIGMNSVTEEIGSRKIIDVVMTKDENAAKMKDPSIRPENFTFDKDKKVKGYVYNEYGDYQANVQVHLFGTAIKVLTDDNGRYEIKVPDEGGLLFYSFEGGKKQIVAIKQKSVIDVELKVEKPSN